MILISVITTVFNSKSFLCKTLDSILNQTFKNFELVIIDDYSTDDSKELIKAYQLNHPKIKLIENEKNHGVSYSQKKGRKMLLVNIFFSLILMMLFQRTH